MPVDASVSAHTRNARRIASEWKRKCVALVPGIRYEETIAEYLDQRIDILDEQDHCAYELKVSGKNAYAEFYKDIVKVLMWNEAHEAQSEKIKEFVFMTEETWGRRQLDTPMPKAFIKFLLAKFELSVKIKYPYKLDSTRNE